MRCVWEPRQSIEESATVRAMSGADASALDADERFDLLCNSRRLYLLEYLHHQDGPAQLTDAATYIAARENEKAPEDLTENERRRAYISLYQTHLPLFTEYGVVEWEEQTNELLLNGDVDLAGYVDADLDESPRWDHYHVAIAVVGLVALALAIPGVYPFGSVPVAWYVLLVSVLTLTLALYQRGSGHVV